MSKVTIGVSHEPGEDGGVMIVVMVGGTREVFEIPKDVALGFLADFARAVCNAHGAPAPMHMTSTIARGPQQ